MFLLITNLIALFFIILLLLILSMIWPPDSPWSPWWRTNKRLAREICKLAKISSRDLIYDLGSGDGTLIIIAAKEFSAKSVGIEIDPLRYLISKFRIKINQLSNKVILKKKNFYEENLTKATVVSIYLVPKALEKLKPKLLKELKPNTRIISFNYKMSLPVVKFDKKNKLYLHKLPKS